LIAVADEDGFAFKADCEVRGGEDSVASGVTELTYGE
jgi:hypothetical protein